TSLCTASRSLPGLFTPGVEGEGADAEASPDLGAGEALALGSLENISALLIGVALAGAARGSTLARSLPGDFRLPTSWLPRASRPAAQLFRGSPCRTLRAPLRPSLGRLPRDG